MLRVWTLQTTQATSQMMRAATLRCSTCSNSISTGACLQLGSNSRVHSSIQCSTSGTSRSSSSYQASIGSCASICRGRGLQALSAAPALRCSAAGARHLCTQLPQRDSNDVRCKAASGNDASTSGRPSTVLTLPTILTLARVAAIPALIGAYFWSSPHGPALCTVLFVVASLTDWLDGYLARKMNTSSAFGAFLDPVADKLMVAAVLILLSTQPLAAGPWAGNSWIMPVLSLVIIGREITMSALREWAATIGPTASAAVAVNQWGKWKTATQMVSLTLLLLTQNGASGPLLEAAATAAVPLLCVAAYLSMHSLALYLKSLWRFMV